MTDEDWYFYPTEPEPDICPYCGRIMSHREAAEQASCNDCYQDAGYR